jgi:hypothetical protein
MAMYGSDAKGARYLLYAECCKLLKLLPYKFDKLTHQA